MPHDDNGDETAAGRSRSSGFSTDGIGTTEGGGDRTQRQSVHGFGDEPAPQTGAERRQRQTQSDFAHDGGLGGGPPPPTEDERDALAQLEEVLRRYGLGELSGWAWEQIQLGKSQAEIMQDLREHPVFKGRFPAIEMRREAGLSPLSPAEYIEYEQRARQLMRASGLPEGFFDQEDDFTQFLANDVSLSELSSRISEGFERAAQAPQEVREEFEEMFGPDSREALASFFLDPDRSVPHLEQALRAGFVAGAGRQFGVDVGQAVSMRLSRLGVNFGQARRGFRQIASQEPLFRETISEGLDLTASEEGVGATFEGDREDVEAIRRRRRQRQADFSGGGGAAFSRSGETGLGSTSE